jgi:hypothetical protein
MSDCSRAGPTRADTKVNFLDVVKLIDTVDTCHWTNNPRRVAVSVLIAHSPKSNPGALGARDPSSIARKSRPRAARLMSRPSGRRSRTWTVDLNAAIRAPQPLIEDRHAAA